VLGYAVRRVLWVIPVLFVASVLTFTLLHAVPGSPWSRDPGVRPIPPEIVARLNHDLGLDQPLPMQYLRWLGGVLRGDFGSTVTTDPTAVGGEILKAAGPTLQLGLMAFLLALLVGIPLGVIGALRHRTAVDYVATGVAMLGMVAPAFLLGALLQLVLGTTSPYHPKLLNLPATGWGGPEHWVLPTLALAGLPLAQAARFTRASVLDVMHQDYVRTARAKGIPERRVVSVHMLRNALIPVITILGPILAVLITGSIVVEVIYRIPGLGRLYINAITNRDYGVVMGMTVVYAGAIALMNLVVDLAYGIIDPRTRQRAR
jgi:oligopeptide transport system permease protein